MRRESSGADGSRGRREHPLPPTLLWLAGCSRRVRRGKGVDSPAQVGGAGKIGRGASSAAGGSGIRGASRCGAQEAAVERVTLIGLSTAPLSEGGIMRRTCRRIRYGCERRAVPTRTRASTCDAGQSFGDGLYCARDAGECRRRRWGAGYVERQHSGWTANTQLRR